MLINVPVYEMQNNTHFVIIYTQSDDGTFKRTQDEPLRLLRDDISGVSMAQGELMSTQYDRHDRSWNTATVTFHYGKPQSFYAFLRHMLSRNKFFVFSKPVLSGHLVKFDVHELKLKNSVSRRKISLLKEKYVEAIDLWTEEELERHQQMHNQKQRQQKAKLMQGVPHGNDNGSLRTGVKALPAHSDRSASQKVVPFRGAGKGTSGTGRQKSAHGVHTSTRDSRGKTNPPAKDILAHLEGDNPFTEKSLFRHSHFIRRFIFSRN